MNVISLNLYSWFNQPTHFLFTFPMNFYARIIDKLLTEIDLNIQFEFVLFLNFTNLFSLRMQYAKYHINNFIDEKV